MPADKVNDAITTSLKAGKEPSLPHAHNSYSTRHHHSSVCATFSLVPYSQVELMVAIPMLMAMTIARIT